MKSFLYLLTVGLGMTATCLSLHAADAKLSASDKEFVMKAAQGGMTEVQAGQLAADKAASPEVKDFGSMMVTDHGKANEELKTIAMSKGVTVPDKLDEKHQAMIDKLSKLSGPEFDKAYVADMVKGHKMTDTLMEKESKSGECSELKSFAGKTDETVKMHLQKIEEIQSKMK